MYSSAFRRLASITQVYGIQDVHLFHNRLTHSLKVAQIGRRIAEHILAGPTSESLVAWGGLDPDVVEASCLAHDIGHPPFGHIAEEELQQCLVGAGLDSFEGNAQSFRIVTRLSVVGTSIDAEPIRGLNLTRATLRAILKYPWHYNDPTMEDSGRKWGAYRSESREMTEALRGSQPNKRSLEAEIMDWADDVTYAVHDLEDFFRAGLIPLHEFARASSTATQAAKRPSPRSDPREEFLDYVHSVKPKWDQTATEAVFDRVAGFFPQTPYEDSPYDRGNLHGFASALISLFIPAFELSSEIAEPDPESRLTVDLLKQLTWYYVINRPSLAAVQTGQREVVRSLFRRLKAAADAAEKSLQDTMRLPARLRYQITLAQKDPEDLQSVNGNLSTLRARVVADFIASLTEAQAYALHGLLSGDPGSAAYLPRWLGP